MRDAATKMFGTYSKLCDLILVRRIEQHERASMAMT